MDKRNRAACLGALLFAAAAASAAAAPGATTTVRISDAAIAVFDLAPADGIDAGYAVDEVGTSLNVRYDVHENGEPVTGDSMSEHPASASEIVLHHGAAHTSAAWAGPLGELALSMHSDSNGTTVSGRASQIVYLTLAPHTGFVLSGQAAQFSDEPATTASNAWEYSSAITVRIHDDFDVTRRINYDRHFTALGGTAYDITDPFSVTLLNNRDTARQVYLSFVLTGEARAPGPLAGISPVPEPAAWLMLGAGMAGLGWHARRRISPAAGAA